MGAVAKLHALEVKRALVDLQLIGVIRTVQQHADAAGVNAAGVLVGQLAVGIHSRERESAAAENSGAVPGQHRAAARLRNGFQHWSGNIVGVGTVDELKIINVEISAAFGAILGRSHTHRIGSGYVHRHLESGNIRLNPNPALTSPVTELTAAHCAVGIVAIVLHIGCRTIELLTIHIAYTAVLVELHIGGREVSFKSAAL